MSTWTIEADGESYVHQLDGEVVGPFKNMVITHQAGGVSTLSFDYSSALAVTEKNIIAYGTEVTLKKDTSVWFKGRVTSNPRLANPDSESQSVIVSNPLHDLSRCTYQQPWLVYTGAEPPNPGDPAPQATVNKSRVILCKNAAGDRITTGGQIANVIAYAQSVGIPLQIGTIDAGTELPFNEQTNLMCLDVINTMMRYLPDHVAWVEYPSTGDPIFHCRAKANLTVSEKPLTDGSLLNFTPREDLRIPGIVITYEITSTVDGNERITVQTDSAGNTSAADTFHATFALNGVQKSYTTASIETTDIPSTGDANSAAMKSYVKRLFPALESIPEGDLTIEAASREGDKENLILKGPVPSWAGDVEEDTQTFRISYQIREDNDENNDVVDSIKGEIFQATPQTTDKGTGTYKILTSLTQGEAVPTGVAASLYQAWNTLHYQGSFTYSLEEVDGACRPGNLFSLSQGSAEIDGKQSIIQTTTENLDTGTTSIEFGPPKRLEADTLIGLIRALRSQRFSFSRNIQDDPDAGSDSGTEISGATPNGPASQTGAQRKRLQIIAENETDEITHKITLDPAQTQFADDDYNENEPTAKDLKPLECFVLVPNGTGLSAQRVQLIGCTPYGDPITILPAGLTQGDLLVFGEEQLERRAVGADKDYLKSDGTTAVWQSPTEGCDEE